MSTIVGLSDADIGALVHAHWTLRSLHDLNGKEEHKEASDRLSEILKRSSSRYGGATDTLPGSRLLEALLAVLPPDEPEEE